MNVCHRWPARWVAAAVTALLVALWPTGPAAATHAYPDVAPWIDPAVSWVDANRYMAGFGDGTFRPGIPMTRAQFARLVYRSAGRPAVDGLPDHGFGDVPPWVEEAVTWLTFDPPGAAPPLMTGFGDGTFRPDEMLKRGQAARLVHGLAGAPPGTVPHGLSDVPPWIEEAVTWLTDDPPGAAPPLMTGFGDGTFRPRGDLTRGQATRVLHRFNLMGTPEITVDVVAAGLSVPWGLAPLPDGRLLFNERRGGLSIREANGAVHGVAADLSDLFASGETGLMGIEIDPGFVANRRFYQCQGRAGSPPTVQVVAWQLSEDGLSAVRVADPLVAGLPTAASGRHGGCRLEFGADGQLWIGTGDAAVGTNPQDLTSLGGKVLRVDPTTGAGSAGNPFESSGHADTRRIFTYGHRNVQGLALRPGTTEIWSVEHGSFRDDEVNRLVAMGNAGWDPIPGYDESVPMTDLVTFPGAMVAAWSSGTPTVAASGGTFLDGAAWGVWDGALAVATLKNSSLRIMRVSPTDQIVSQDVPAELDGDHGRLRTPELGPDGALYVTTANGGGDTILRITPTP